RPGWRARALSPAARARGAAAPPGRAPPPGRGRPGTPSPRRRRPGRTTTPLRTRARAPRPTPPRPSRRRLPTRPRAASRSPGCKEGPCPPPLLVLQVLDIPDHDGGVLAARGEDLPVRRERQRPDQAPVPAQRPPLLAGGRVQQADGAVGA